MRASSNGVCTSDERYSGDEMMVRFEARGRVAAVFVVAYTIPHASLICAWCFKFFD